MSEQRASAYIKDAITCGGTPVQVCDFCGRTHYVSSGRFMDEGELEAYRQKDRDDPSRYIERSDDSISYGQVEGKTYVWGCGCEQSEDRLWRIENFIWCHRQLIADYLRKRADSLKAESDDAERIATQIMERF